MGKPFHVDEIWLEDHAGLYSADYWNDEGEEASKEFNISSPDDQKLVDHMTARGICSDVADAIHYLNGRQAPLDRVLDLAAGTCWLSAILSREPNVRNIDAVEFSRHRIGKLAPNTILSFKGKPEKIRRIVGSFYDIKSPPNTYDAVFMSAAFHHADRVVDLIASVKRVMKPGGCLVLIDELPITVKRLIKRIVLTALRRKKLVLDYTELFPPDPELGDHYYLFSHYKLLLGGGGFDFERIPARSGHFLAVATKR
jgi:SAM-dependent methyltransferase